MSKFIETLDLTDREYGETEMAVMDNASIVYPAYLEVSEVTLNEGEPPFKIGISLDVQQCEDLIGQLLTILNKGNGDE